MSKKQETKKKEPKTKEQSKTIEKKQNSIKTTFEFMCIRQSLDSEGRFWEVGDSIIATQAPSKHFKKVKGKLNPLQVLRDKLDEEGVVWSEDWSLSILERELKAIEDFKRRKSESKRRREEDTIIKRKKGE